MSVAYIGNRQTLKIKTAIVNVPYISGGQGGGCGSDVHKVFVVFALKRKYFDIRYLKGSIKGRECRSEVNEPRAFQVG